MVTKLSTFLLLGLMTWNIASASNIAYERVKAAGVVAHVVTMNLADPNVKVTVALSKNGTGSSEPFKSMMNRTHPAAAITGTFFCTRTLIPTGDIAVYGTVVHSGCLGAALCIGSDNKASVVPIAQGRKTNWAGYETVLCAGPTLISGGKISIALRREGFHNGLTAPTRRTAVGITKSGKLLIVAVNSKSSLHAVAKLMLKLDTQDALCLDGGSSTAFYCKGRYFAVPSRKLTNCLVAYSSSTDYARAKILLAPARLFARAEKTVAENPITIGRPSQDIIAFSSQSQPQPDNETPQIYAASR